MLCVPAARTVVLQPAVREFPAPVIGAVAQVAIEVPPSLKLTLPVGALPTTVAVKVTTLPRLVGVSDVTTLVVLFTLTSCESAGLLETPLEGSPL